MSEVDGKNQGKITLDIELKDIVDMVSRSKAPPFGSTSPQQAIESEELRKAWFHHVLLSMEKLSDTVQEIRIKDLVVLRKEIRTDLEGEIKKIDRKVDKNKEELELYKKETINPIRDKLTVLLTKIGVWGVFAGFIGSGLMVLIVYIVKTYMVSKGLQVVP